MFSSGSGTRGKLASAIVLAPELTHKIDCCGYQNIVVFSRARQHIRQNILASRAVNCNESEIVAHRLAGKNLEKTQQSGNLRGPSIDYGHIGRVVQHHDYMGVLQSCARC